MHIAKLQTVTLFNFLGSCLRYKFLFCFSNVVLFFICVFMSLFLVARKFLQHT